MTVKELRQILSLYDDELEVAIGYDSGIGASLDHVGMAIVDEWDNICGSESPLVVVCGKDEVDRIDDWVDRV